MKPEVAGDGSRKSGKEGGRRGEGGRKGGKEELNEGGTEGEISMD